MARIVSVQRTGGLRDTKRIFQRRAVMRGVIEKRAAKVITTIRNFSAVQINPAIRGEDQPLTIRERASESNPFVRVLIDDHWPHRAITYASYMDRHRLVEETYAPGAELFALLGPFFVRILIDAHWPHRAITYASYMDRHRLVEETYAPGAELFALLALFVVGHPVYQRILNQVDK